MEITYLGNLICISEIILTNRVQGVERRVLRIKDMIEEMLFWPKKNTLFLKISDQNIQ